MFKFLYRSSPGSGNSLGARLPLEKPYAKKYPLTRATTPSTETPVVLGIPWYDAFDSPKLDLLSGRYWIGRGKLGYIRGGHAVCLKPYNLTDEWRWWKFYNQGNEGACVGFSLSRAMSLMNRVVYDGFWLYHSAQPIDEWPETPPEEGTSVDAGCQILLNKGHRRVVIKNGVRTVLPLDENAGISAYRWAENVDDIHSALKNPVADKLGALPILNSWGLDYPHVVWLPDEVMDMMMEAQGGEAVVVTDE